MSEFIVPGIVVVGVLLAFAAYKFGWVPALKADLQKLEDSLKSHVTAASPAPVVDHAAIVNAAANVVAAANPPSSLVQSFTGNGTQTLPPPNVTPTAAGGDQGQSMMLNALLGSSTLKKPDVQAAGVPTDPRKPDPVLFGKGQGTWMSVEGSNSIAFPISAGSYTTQTGAGDVINGEVVVDGVATRIPGEPFTVAKDSTGSLTATGNGTIQLRRVEAVVHTILPGFSPATEIGNFHKPGA